MTVTSATIGMGAIFGIGDGIDGGSVTFIKIGEVTNISPPTQNREAIDATHLESDEDYREFIPGLKDGDSATITFNYVPTATDAIYTQFNIGKGDFELIYPSGLKFQFSGVVTGWKPGDASTTTMVGELTIKQSGPPTLLAA